MRVERGKVRDPGRPQAEALSAADHHNKVMIRVVVAGRVQAALPSPANQTSREYPSLGHQSYVLATGHAPILSPSADGAETWRLGCRHVTELGHSV